MTTKEFKKKIEGLGYSLYVDDFDMIVKLGGYNTGITLMTIYFDDIGSIDTTWNGFDNLLEKDKIELLKLGFDYIITPIVDRVEEEKFYWRVKGWSNMGVAEKYLFVNERTWSWELEQTYQSNKYTQKDYERFVEIKLIADIFEKEPIE